MTTNLRTGCQRFLLLFIASAMVLLLSIAAAIKYIGWWAGLVVLVLTVIIVRWLVKRAVVRLMMAPFTMKSRVLRGARIEIQKVEKVPAPPKRGPGGFVEHPASRVTAETVHTPLGALPPGQDVIDPRQPAPQPAPPPEVHEPEILSSNPAPGPRKTYWRIEALITPRPTAGLMSHWEPAEMVLVPYASRTDYHSVKKIEGIYPELVEILQDGRWTTDVPPTTGPARIRYTFPLTLAEQESRWKLRYYFEPLGNIRFE